MIQYTRPSVDNLINNVPDVLKSSHQFLSWNLERGAKKVPLKDDGSSWGSYKDRSCWRMFDAALDLVDRGKAFGLGLVLPVRPKYSFGTVVVFE
jgi:primase-polymerase (primpol)-like protein